MIYVDLCNVNISVTTNLSITMNMWYFTFAQYGVFRTFLLRDLNCFLKKDKKKWWKVLLHAVIIHSTTKILNICQTKHHKLAFSTPMQAFPSVLFSAHTTPMTLGSLLFMEISAFLCNHFWLFFHLTSKSPYLPLYLIRPWCPWSKQSYKRQQCQIISTLDGDFMYLFYRIMQLCIQLYCNYIILHQKNQVTHFSWTQCTDTWWFNSFPHSC